MKNKDIKRRFKRKINSGWREYLPITIHKKHLGMSNEEFPTIKNIERCLGMEYLMDSGVVNHYTMTIPKESVDGLTKVSIVKLRDERIYTTLEDTLSRVREWYTDDDGNLNMTYLATDKTVYYLEYIEGFLNPNYSESLESEEPFWHESYDVEEGVLIDDGDGSVIELLQMFANEDKLKEVLYSENWILPMLGEHYNSTSGLGTDLAKLESYTKTLYFDFKGDDIIITYAIRYKSNVKPFLKDLKALVKKYKHINFR